MITLLTSVALAASITSSDAHIEWCHSMAALTGTQINARLEGGVKPDFPEHVDANELEDLTAALDNAYGPDINEHMDKIGMVEKTYRECLVKYGVGK